MTKITLNADKRKMIADIFQNHFEQQPSKAKIDFESAKQNFDSMVDNVHQLANTVVRHHQPQEDLDTIKAMELKYGNSGGVWNTDACFNFIKPTIEVNQRGEEYTNKNELNVSFELTPSVQEYSGTAFAYAYYHDELKAKGFNPNYHLQWGNEKKNPRYYEEESRIDSYLGINRRSENDNSTYNPHNDWKNKYQLEVIGSSYCSSREFKVDDTTHKVFETFKIAQSKLCQTHETFFNYINDKMSKLRLGLKSYKTFDQAKELADKLGVVLNDSMLEGTSSMALSVFSPTNLADMLKDSEEDNAKELIKQAFLQAKMQRESVN
jgi:hypothetical protein